MMNSKLSGGTIFDFNACIDLLDLAQHMQFTAEQGENMIQRWFLEMHRIHFACLILHRQESAGIGFLKEAFKKSG